MTNFDRLKTMTLEEMAKVLVDFKDCSKDCLIHKVGKHCFDICDNQQKLADWLNQEATP